MSRITLHSAATRDGTIWNIRHLQGFNTATYPSVSTTHYLADHLGSTSMALTVEGWPTQTSEFQPYGQDINWVASANHYKFTGQERDSESGLDHFMFRTYSSTAGRWMSADPYLGSTAALGAARVVAKGLEMGVMLSSDTVKPDDAAIAKCNTRFFAETDRCTAKYGSGGRFGKNRAKGACLDRAFYRYQACVTGKPDPGPPMASVEQNPDVDAELASLIENAIVIDFGNDMGNIQ